MPPNTVNNNSSDNVPVRRKGQQQNEQRPKEDQQVNEKADDQSTEPEKKLHTDVRVQVALAIAAFLVVILSPTTLKQLAYLKRTYYHRTAVADPFTDSRPVASKSVATGPVVDPDTGVEYEYHQFMATVEQHFPNIR